MPLGFSRCTQFFAFRLLTMHPIFAEGAATRASSSTAN
jgi:hypothetical protein